MSRTRFFAGFAFAVTLAACGEAGGDPVGPTPGGPSMDGGFVVGGNHTDTTVVTSSSAETAEETGGFVVGGNR